MFGSYLWVCFSAHTEACHTTRRSFTVTCWCTAIPAAFSFTQCLFRVAEYHPDPPMGLEWRKWLGRAVQSVCTSLKNSLSTPGGLRGQNNHHWAKTVPWWFTCGTWQGHSHIFISATTRIRQITIIRAGKPTRCEHHIRKSRSVKEFLFTKIYWFSRITVITFRWAYHPKAPQSRQQRTRATVDALVSSVYWAAAGFCWRRDCWLEHL